MKKLSTLLLGIVVALLVSAAGCQQLDQARKTYESSTTGISFQYPSELTLVNESAEVLLKHGVPLVHPDPCDFEGGGEDLTELTDFHVTMQIFPLNLAGTVAATQHSSFVQDYFPDGQFKLSEGHIREYQQGDLRGHEVTQGVEGCGFYLYYFPLEADTTFVVKRAFITELSTLSPKKDEYLRLSGIMSPEKELTVFEQILRDFDYRKP